MKKIILDINIVKKTLNEFEKHTDAAAYLNISIDKLRQFCKENNIAYRKSYCGKLPSKIKEHPEIDKQWLIDN